MCQHLSQILDPHLLVELVGYCLGPHVTSQEATIRILGCHVIWDL
jgi:hypothetical protein